MEAVLSVDLQFGCFTFNFGRDVLVDAGGAKAFLGGAVLLPRGVG